MHFLRVPKDRYWNKNSSKEGGEKKPLYGICSKKKKKKGGVGQVCGKTRLTLS